MDDEYILSELVDLTELVSSCLSSKIKVNSCNCETSFITSQYSLNSLLPSTFPSDSSSLGPTALHCTFLSDILRLSLKELCHPRNLDRLQKSLFLPKKLWLRFPMAMERLVSWTCNQIPSM